MLFSVFLCPDDKIVAEHVLFHTVLILWKTAFIVCSNIRQYVTSNKSTRGECQVYI